MLAIRVWVWVLVSALLLQSGVRFPGLPALSVKETEQVASWVLQMPEESNESTPERCDEVPAPATAAPATPALSAPLSGLCGDGAYPTSSRGRWYAVSPFKPPERRAA